MTQEEAEERARLMLSMLKHGIHCGCEWCCSLEEEEHITEADLMVASALIEASENERLIDSLGDMPGYGVKV